VRAALLGAAPTLPTSVVLPLTLASVEVPAGDVAQYDRLLAARS
jgi:hypothetical protein